MLGDSANDEIGGEGVEQLLWWAEGSGISPQ